MLVIWRPPFRNLCTKIQLQIQEPQMERWTSVSRHYLSLDAAVLSGESG